jgi:CHAT domain-containing protein/tetratricopeptide (TPR) repeat protein
MQPSDQKNEASSIVASLIREAASLRAAGQLTAALERGVAASERARSGLGCDSLGFRTSINVIAGVYFDQRNYVTSRALLEWLVRTAAQSGDDLHFTAVVDANRAHCLLREGYRSEAGLLLFDAFERLVTEDVAAALQCLHGVAQSAFELGLYDSSAEMHRRVLDCRRAITAADDPELATSLHNLAGALRGSGNCEEAAQLYAEATQIWRVKYGDNHSTVFQALLGQADALHILGRFEEAALIYRRLIELARTARDDKSGVLPELRSRLIGCMARVALAPEPQMTYEDPPNPFSALTKDLDQDSARSYEDCVRSFMARDYSGCVRAALDHSQKTQRHDVIQLLSIALSRLGLHALAERVTDWALDISAGTPYRALLALTAGRIDLSSARATAARAGIEHEYEFYAACRLSGAGEFNVATEMFERLCTRRPRSLEAILAWPERLLRGVSVDSIASSHPDQIATFALSVERLHAIQTVRNVQGEISRFAEAGEIDRALTRSRSLSASLAERGDAFAEELAESLNNTAHILFTNGRYEESLPYYEQSLAVLRSNSASSSVLVGAASNNLGNLYRELGRHADAVRLQLEAMRARLAAYGDAHPSVLLSLLDLGLAHEAAGEPEEARRRYQEALEVVGLGIAELKPFVQRLRGTVTRALAADDFDAARSSLGEALRAWETSAGERKKVGDLHALANLHLEARNTGRAEAYLANALRQIRTNPTLDQVAAAECLYGLGQVNEARGELSAAAGQYREAFDILGETGTARLLAVILLAMARTGDHTEAEDYAQKALRIAEDAGDHPVQAAAWHQFGAEQRTTSRLDEALSSFEKALTLRDPDDSLGRVQDMIELARLAVRDSRLERAEAWLSDVEALIRGEQPVPPSSSAVCLQLRGKIALARGRNDEALASLRAALEDQSRTAPSNMSLRGSILADLGPVFGASGETRLACNLLEEAIKLLSAEEMPIDTGLVHMSLANCEYSLGLLGKASANIVKAHELLEPVLPPNHSRLGDLWHIAGAINLSVGARKTAGEQLRRARGIFVRLQGPDAAVISNIDLRLATLQHLDGRWEESLAAASQAAVGLERSGLRDDLPYKWQAFALAALGRSEAAIETMLLRATIAAANFRRVAVTLPTADLAHACARMARVLDDLLSLAINPTLSTYASKVFAAVQRGKAIAAETFAVQRQVVAASASEDVRVRWRELAELRSLIGRTLLQNPEHPLTADERQFLAGWEARAAELERDLVRGEPFLDLSNRFRTPEAADIAARLSSDEMLVEYVRFEGVDFRNPTTSVVESLESGRYCAFALIRQASGTPSVKLFDLGAAADLEKKVQDFREAIVTRHSAIREHGEALRQRLLDPVVAAMGEPKTLIVAADGALNAMPFDALTWTDGRWLVDAFPVSFVDVARDLLRVERKSGWNDPMVIAAPAFNLREGAGPDPPSSEYVAFRHLKGAEREGRAVAARLGVEPLMGTSALESALRSARSPRILHLATHGFFIPKVRYGGRPDVFESGEILNVPGEGSYIIGAERPSADEDSDSLVHPSRLENPLLRSGIVLAGANTWLAGGILPVAAEDGVVTGLDVTDLDLAGTSLVVLSACETGLGVTEGGNGVLGLRQAFLLAGASTVIASIWKVADEVTTDLMDEFYRRLLAGESRSGALRKAKLDIRARGFQDPIFWAAFICVGDSSPIS